MNQKQMLTVSSVLFIAFLLSACSTPEPATKRSKFKGYRSSDIAFFSDNTMTMMSNLNLQMGRNETLLTRRFIDRTAPEEQRMIQLDRQFQNTIRGLVDYSVKIVNISLSDRTQEEMIEQYGNYLMGFRDAALRDQPEKAAIFDRIIEEVREQDSLFNALKTAHPILHSSIMDAILDIEDMVDAINVVATKVDDQIEEEYADIRRYRKILEDEKSSILSAFTVIYSAYKTDEPELSELKKTGVIWTPEIIPDGVPTRDNLNEIGEHLSRRLQAMHTVYNEINPDWIDYLNTHAELRSVTKRTMDRIQQTQIIMLTWIRAHKKMADGVTNPADWFDFGGTTKKLLSTGTDAIL
jgi:hypothetical protein